MKERWLRWLQVDTWIFAVFKRQVEKGEGTRKLWGGYKFFWMGREDRVSWSGGVGG